MYHVQELFVAFFMFSYDLERSLPIFDLLRVQLMFHASLLLMSLYCVILGGFHVICLTFFNPLTRNTMDLNIKLLINSRCKCEQSFAM